jgi:hypothetical protein
MTLTYRYSTPRVYTRRWLWTSFSASTAWPTFDPINKRGIGQVTIHKVGGRQRLGSNSVPSGLSVILSPIRYQHNGALTSRRFTKTLRD